MNDHIDATAAAIGSKVTYAGAASAALGGITSSELGVLIGALVGLFGLLVNVYFKRRTDQREQREHEMRMRKLVTQPTPLSKE